MHQPVIVGEKRRAEPVGELDVEAVADREVVSVGPRPREQDSDSGTAKRPADELIEGDRGLSGGQNIGVLPPAQNACHLDIEMLRDGQVGTGGYEPPECFPPGGFGDQFDAGGGIDDDSDDQTSPSARSSASVSTALTGTGTAGRRSKVSNQVARAADRSRSVIPSSMNSSGGSSRSRGRRAIRPRYRDSTPLGLVAPISLLGHGLGRPEVIGSIEPVDDRP
jgi:hypothetical protein